MSKISSDLPVKLEELCQFTFNFNNLIKIIDYLHHQNLYFQENINDANKRIDSLELLKNDIEDLKIKTTNIEKTNDNLNRSFSNLHETLLSYDSKMSEMQTKVVENESKIKTFEITQKEQEKNLNRLNVIVEDNEKNFNQLNNLINYNTKNISKISEKIKENEKKVKENFENVNKSIKEMNSHYERDHNEIENINNNISEINTTIKNLINNFEKKNSDMNNRIINIINDMVDMNNNIAKTNINNNNNDNNNISKNNENNNINTNKYESEVKINIANYINKDMANANLFKIAMDDIEEEKNKFRKLKEDYELNKEKQKKENDSFRKNINDLIDELNNLIKKVGENSENLQNIENKYLSDAILKNVEKEKNIEKPQIIIHEDINIEKYLNKYVTFDIFKKLSDNVSILKSSLNTKGESEDIENKFKKMNQRLEIIEMIQQGQTNGPRKRIDLSLVNKKFKPIDTSNVSNNSEEIGDIGEFDFIIKKIEKNINDNLINLINKEIQSFDLTLNPKINEVLSNVNKNREDIDKNYKTIVDLRNIILTNPSKNDLINLKKDIETLEEESKTNTIKILDLTKNIEGTGQEEEDPENALKGTIKERLNFLNRSCISLNLKLSSIENKNRNLTKEVKDEIKQSLKNETSKIMQQFKSRLESFSNKFEYELKSKIDQIGLTDFENKMNNKIHIDLKDKLDKNEMRKNNNMIKRKIDSLESKISKTLVDTIIDLQMDDQPLIVKKNINGVDICASCNQSMPKNNNNYTIGATEYMPVNLGHKNKAKHLNKSFINFNKPSNNKLSINSEKNINLNLSLGQNNKLPDIIPSVYQK